MKIRGQILLHALGIYTPHHFRTCPAAFSFFVKQLCPLKNAIYLEPVVIWQTPVGHVDNARGKLFKIVT